MSQRRRAWFVPVIVRLPLPVIEVVGNVPMSPTSVVGPVLVMPAPARTAKLSAVPRPTEVAAACALTANIITRPVDNMTREEACAEDGQARGCGLSARCADGVRIAERFIRRVSR